MRYVQGGALFTGAALLLWAAITSFGLVGSNIFSLVWAIQFLGLSAVFGTIGFAAMAPDRPQPLKKSR